MRSIFQSAGPVVGERFVGRGEELGALTTAVEDLKQGQRRLYCVLGPRKIGKTSLLEELTRRITNDPELLPCRVDLYEANTPNLFFTRLSLGLLDAFIRKQYGGPVLSGLIHDETALTVAASRLAAHGIGSMDQALAATLELVRGDRRAGRHYRCLLDLPAELAAETGLRPVVMIDEFQELLRFGSFKQIRESVGDLLKLIRARWQHHEQVAYIISGSEVSLLEGMISSESSPLFGHFIPLRLGPFSTQQALSFVVEGFERAGIEIPQALANNLVAICGGHPFYLQVLGEDICLRAEPGPLAEDLFKETIQDALFSSTGRLHLHFARAFHEHIGRSSTLERVLVALATGHASVSGIAGVTNQRTGAVSTALRQLMERDLVSRDPNGTYAVRDETFAVWVAGNRSDLRSVAGPYYLGDDAERSVCRHLGREGFQLVYRSRGSRGAFDLLALLGTLQIGLQVKRSRLPLYLSRTGHARVIEWGRKLGWAPILVAYVAEEDRCLFFDVRVTGRRLKTRVRYDEADGRELLLELVSQPV